MCTVENHPEFMFCNRTGGAIASLLLVLFLLAVPGASAAAAAVAVAVVVTTLAPAAK